MYLLVYVQFRKDTATVVDVCGRITVGHAGSDDCFIQEKSIESRCFLNTKLHCFVKILEIDKSLKTLYVN